MWSNFWRLYEDYIFRTGNFLFFSLSTDIAFFFQPAALIQAVLALTSAQSRPDLNIEATRPMSTTQLCKFIHIQKADDVTRSFNQTVGVLSFLHLSFDLTDKVIITQSQKNLEINEPVYYECHSRHLEVKLTGGVAWALAVLPRASEVLRDTENKSVLQVTAALAEERVLSRSVCMCVYVCVRKLLQSARPGWRNKQPLLLLVNKSVSALKFHLIWTNI